MSDEGYGNRQYGGSSGGDYNRNENRGGYEGRQGVGGDNSEYGGGGRGNDNYYSSGNDFEGGERRHQGGGGSGSYGGGNGGSYGGGDDYNRNENMGGLQGHQSRQDNNNSYGKTGGAEYNRPDFNQGGSGGGGYGNDDPSRFNSAMEHANQHAGSSGDGGLFQNALSHLQNNSSRIQNEGIDEQHAVQAHQQLYGNQGGGNSQHSNETMGTGAAMQALNMFTSGGGGQGQGGGLGGGAGGGQNQFIGMAMAQASKLFDQQSSQGNVAQNASKDSVVKTAAEQALKMYMKSQMGGGGPAMGGSSGGMGGLMSLASKFM